MFSHGTTPALVSFYQLWSHKLSIIVEINVIQITTELLTLAIFSVNLFDTILLKLRHASIIGIYRLCIYRFILNLAHPQ